MVEVAWARYPRVAETPLARVWLKMQADLGLAANTIDAYGRGLDQYLAFCDAAGVYPLEANRADIASFVNHLRSRPNLRRNKVKSMGSGSGLSHATLRQRVTAVRLFHDYLLEEGLREDNPVGRGRYTPGKGFGGGRGLVPNLTKLPWIPSEDDWAKVLAEARRASPRNRLMLALAYDSALRREELCLLATSDVDPAHRTIRVRAETTKGGHERVVPYSEATGDLYGAYLVERRKLDRKPGRIFLSESRRNRGEPVSFWAWSKVVRGISLRSGVENFSTHTLRHLCLTDLARCGWDIHEIARFAGHKNTQTTLQYVHLSGRDLASKLERGMAQIHAWRVGALVGFAPAEGSPS